MDKIAGARFDPEINRIFKPLKKRHLLTEFLFIARVSAKFILTSKYRKPLTAFPQTIWPPRSIISKSAR